MRFICAHINEYVADFAQLFADVDITCQKNRENFPVLFTSFTVLAPSAVIIICLRKINLKPDTQHMPAQFKDTANYQ
jgi:hypothetical protein